MARSKSVPALHTQQHVIATCSSPLPPAREMQAMAMVDPDFPDRIMRMAEKEQDFRHRYNMSLAVRAQYMTAIPVLGGLVSAVIIALSGSMLASAVIAVSTIVTSAVASLWGRKTL